MSKSINEKAVKAMKESRGRFFGMYLNSGEVFNAQFRKETPQTVVVFDRSSKQERRINKASIRHVNISH